MEKIQADLTVSDVTTGKQMLGCKKHKYVGNPQPPSTQGCANCWMAFFGYDLFIATAKNKQYERMQELEQAIRHVTELSAKGKFDFKPFRHPKIRVDKEDKKEDGEI